MALVFKRANYQSPGESGKRGLDDLVFYQLALDIVVNADEMANHLPPYEKYDSARQVRRSSKGITANIAEGYGRYHYLDSLHYYSIARGELLETQAHFTNALVLACIPQEYFNQVYELIRKTEIALNGYMNYIRKQRAGREEYGDRSIREEHAKYHIDDTNTEETQTQD